MTTFMYRRLFASPRVHVIFQNPDDAAVYQELGVLHPDRVSIIKGSGVDTQKFSPDSSDLEHPPVVVFASRLLEEKGIRELMGAARILKDRGVEFRLKIAGEPDPGNPSSVGAGEVAAWARAGLAEFPGHVDDVAGLLGGASLVVLPSYREGTPRILLEAAAMGKGIVTTDVPGCRQVVQHGLTGLLVPHKETAPLADAMEELLRDEARRSKMGAAGREWVVSEFDETSVLERTMDVYRGLGSGEGVGPVVSLRLG